MEPEGRIEDGWKIVSTRRVGGKIRAYSALSAINRKIGVPLALEYGDWWTRGINQSPLFAFGDETVASDFISRSSRPDDLFCLKARLLNSWTPRHGFTRILHANHMGNDYQSVVDESKLSNWWMFGEDGSMEIRNHIDVIRNRIVDFWNKHENARSSERWATAIIPPGTLMCDAVCLCEGWRSYLSQWRG